MSKTLFPLRQVAFVCNSILLFCLLCINQGFVAQVKTAQLPDNTIVRRVVDSLATQVARYYVDKEIALKMAASIRKNYKDGRYKNISDEHVLAGVLTSDLRAIHRDEHMHVEFNP